MHRTSTPRLRVLSALIVATLLTAPAWVHAQEPCAARAGTMSTDYGPICLDGGDATLSGIPSGTAVVPDGYVQAYLLTRTNGLIIEQMSTAPEFTVSGVDIWRIHSLVYDPATLDASLLAPGAYAYDLQAHIVQGGGDVCASLDISGAPVKTGECPMACTAKAAAMHADTELACLVDGEATLTAAPVGPSTVPPGFEQIFILTRTNGLIIEQMSTTPEFTVSGVDIWRIHDLIYDPATLDLSAWPAGTYLYDLQALLVQGGGAICASLDISGAPMKTGECSTACTAKAAAMHGDTELACLVDGEATLTAAPMGPSTVPPGFAQIFILTRTNGLIIEQMSTTPEFTVSGVDIWRIHDLIYDPATLDLSAWPAGTYLYDLQALLVQGGGAICASLDISGAPMKTGECTQGCAADAGTLTPSYFECMSIFSTGALLTATADGNAYVPPGYTALYLLSVEEQGGLIIDMSASPGFVIHQPAHYTIHTLVYDPTTLATSTIQLDTTSIADLNALLIQGGGSICASLDMEGATIAVAYCTFCTAGIGTTITLCYDDPPVDLFGLLTGDPCPGGMWLPPLPAGVFDPAVAQADSYAYVVDTYHGVSISTVIVNVVECPSSCEASAGTLTAEDPDVCLVNGEGLMAAAPNSDAEVPDGYVVAYVLAEGPDGIIRNVEPMPMFAWPLAGSFSIHPFVYDPATFDLAAHIDLDITTLDEVSALLAPNGGDICADLGPGTSFTISECPPPCGPGENVDLVACYTDAPFALFDSIPGNPCPGGQWSDPAGQAVSGIFNPFTDPAGTYAYSIITPNGDTMSVLVSVDLIECGPVLCDGGESTAVTVCFTDLPFVLYGALGGTPCPNGTWTGPDGNPTDGLFAPLTDPAGVYTYLVMTQGGWLDTSTVTVELVQCQVGEGVVLQLEASGDNDTATGMDNATHAGISLWPNPTADLLRVRLPFTPNGGTRIELFDATGRAAAAPVRMLADGLQLDTGALTPGAWTLRVIDAGQVLTGRFVRAAR